MILCELQGIWKSARVRSGTFGQKSHYFSKIALYEIISQNPSFLTFGPKLHFFTLFGKNHTSLKQNHTFFSIFPTLFQMPWNYIEKS